LLIEVLLLKKEGGMKKRTCIFLFLLSLLLVSCNQIKNTFDLLSLFNSLDYSYMSFYGPGNELTVTEDVHIVGTVTISSKWLKIPEECSSIDYCRAMVSFENKYEAEGISVSEKEGVWLLTLSNVTVRFRPVIVNLGGPPPYGGGYMSYPVIQLLQPSYEQCGNTSIKCDVDKVCYENYPLYCSYCEQLSQRECDCRDQEGVYPDGTDCIIITGDDTYENGECRSGKCEGLRKHYKVLSGKSTLHKSIRVAPGLIFRFRD
jgi:hypothetical protein